MKQYLLILIGLLCTVAAYAGIDMQAHVASDEGRSAYTTYLSRQTAYYSGNYLYTMLVQQDGDRLFGTLNELMGNTCRISGSGFSYNSLRSEYVNVDRDLNKAGNIIGYYDGSTMNGTWDGGKTYNREHTWPQSKGADKGTAMGHDMQSVRPASVKVNSDRGNIGYGESNGYYDPNEVSISNSDYKGVNNGTYRGDCARVILYDYVVYGEAGGYKSGLYNGNAQLLSKLGSAKDGVFESVEVMLKWHMQDPPSLTEMVRNDGGQDYQGNRNPFIDWPELAVQVLRNEVTTYSVSSNQTLAPAYRLTTKHGFVAYLTNGAGEHPHQVEVTGARYRYEEGQGRLTVTDVTDNVEVTTDMPSALATLEESKVDYYVAGNRLVVSHAGDAPVEVYTLSGQRMQSSTGMTEYEWTLPRGVYVLRAGNYAGKIVIY
ncbi:MAG: endonuclease [Paludibacteraceae bacterium]|nr:endonuclease [Paludibacteraceae bacterium]